MPIVTPEFQPSAGPGEFTSIMDRAQQSVRSEKMLAMQQQQEDIRKQQWDIQRPVMEAKQAADIAGLGAQLYEANDQQKKRLAWDAAYPQAQEEFNDAIRPTSYTLSPDGETVLPDKNAPRNWMDMYDKLMGLSQKYAWAGTTDEGKSFLKNTLESASQMHVMAVTDASNKLKQYESDNRVRELAAAAGMRLQGTMYTADQGVAKGIIAGQAQRDVASENHRRWMDYEQFKADAAVGKSDAQIKLAMADEQNENELAAAAIKNQDYDSAKFHAKQAATYHDQSVKLSTQTGQMPSRPAKVPSGPSTPAAPPPAADTPAAQPVPTPAQSFTGTSRFSTLDEAQHFADMKQLMPGDRIIINGVPGTWK